MDKLWHLMTAIFMIVAAVAVIVLCWLLTGGALHNAIVVITVYASIFMVLIGIAKGLLVIIDHNRESKSQE